MMNRRAFLGSLVATGLLPLTPAVGATLDDLVEQLDRELAREPLHFLVDTHGELSLADWEPALDRFTAYDVAPEDLDPREARFADRLWQLDPLRVEVAEFFREQQEAYGQFDMGQDDWDYDEEAVMRLVGASNRPTLAALRKHLLAWFAEDVSSEERDRNDIVRPVDGRQWAFRMFWSDVDGLGEAFDIVVIEGEHPGSSYYAAQMGLSVVEANRVARQLGLPITFSRAG